MMTGSSNSCQLSAVSFVNPRRRLQENLHRFNRRPGCSYYLAMPTHRIRARKPRGVPSLRPLQRDADVLAAVREDAAHFPGGHALALAAPANEAEVAQLLHDSAAVLPIGAQSSLTGGATPMGDVVMTMSAMAGILAIESDRVRVQPGVTLTLLDEALRAEHKHYRPTPTFLGATVGGVIATNAAGAATFKYGSTRAWVEAMTVVLATGDVLDLVRGDVVAHADGWFDLELAAGTIRIARPSYQMPDVPKVSAGYFAAPRMDLIDLFIGSEGTLGVVTEATLRILSARPATCLAFAPFRDRTAAFGLVEHLRTEAIETWRTSDPNGMDVAAIEHMDARSIALLREDRADQQFGVRIPRDAAIALLITLELPAGMAPAQAFEEIGRFRDIDTPLARLCRAFDRAGVLDDVEIAVPGDEARAAQLLGVREAVPAAVNARVGRAARAIDPRITKTAADMIVPFERVAELMALYDEEFDRRGLDGAVWGHISDGNLHPNVIPRSAQDVESGKDAIRAFGRAVIQMGGSPLAEHGVGRHPIKQELLREMYGARGVDEMRAIKRALDPEWKLAPGVLFPR
jgi:D-lactate dehydrogenase (cytochrome)